MLDVNTSPRLVYSAGESTKDDPPLQIVDRLRECLFRGEFPAGSRLSEPALANHLGVSRTPIRAALQRLQIEGWLECTSNGGYRVSQFALSDVASAVAVHAALQGLAVRLAAEQGAPPALMSQAREIFVRMDLLLEVPQWTQEHVEAYITRHNEFHATLGRMARCTLLDNTIKQIDAHPLSIAARVFFCASNVNLKSRSVFAFANELHRGILDSIKLHQGSRAEALIREHAALLERHLLAVSREHVLPFLSGARQ